MGAASEMSLSFLLKRLPFAEGRKGRRKWGLNPLGRWNPAERGKRRRRKETCWAPPHERTEGGGKNAAQKLASSSLPPSLIPFFSARHAFRAVDLGRFFFAPGRFVDGWLGLAVPPSSLLRY